jgi:hypothetical protein
VRLQLELKDFLTKEQIKLLIELQEVLQEGSTSPDGTKVPLSPEVCCNADDLCREIAMSILTSTRNMTGGLRGV